MELRVTIKKKPVAIQTPYIRLDDLLKFAAAVASGGQAKEAVQSGAVRYNGAVCVMRGKKVYPGDVVDYDGVRYEVTARDGT